MWHDGLSGRQIAERLGGITREAHARRAFRLPQDGLAPSIDGGATP
jgi:hypothetical protein